MAHFKEEENPQQRPLGVSATGDYIYERVWLGVLILEDH
jgi:hypothetical protein